ncbi:MAG: NADH-quinone oxidoreductase subunit L, partial [Bacteroidetes bacterium]|nr:NADH-quinone oxidoreductase subunit L [Bacteroidota bacterium]
MSNYAYVVLIPLLPLVAFVLLGLFGRRYFRVVSGGIGVLAVLVSAGLSIWTAYRYFFVDGITGVAYRQVVAVKAAWLSFSPGLSIDMSVILDPIAVMMIVVVSFVSLMVHIFSLGYMKGEAR